MENLEFQVTNLTCIFKKVGFSWNEESLKLLPCGTLTKADFTNFSTDEMLFKPVDVLKLLGTSILLT